MPALKVCSVPGCPIPTRKSRCPKHEREADAARGRRAERGYGYEHVKLRAQWGRAIRGGTPVTCPRCGTRIRPDDDWDLGHTDDRQGYVGPEHARCNRSAAAKSRPR